MIKSVKVSDYMLRRPVVVQPDSELFAAIHLILMNKISGVTVVDERNHPVGMLSELDALRAILTGTYYQQEVGTIRVSDHMTLNVDCVAPNDDVIDVAQSMLELNRRRRPVIDSHGAMVGQVTCRQLLKVMKDFDMPEDRRES